MTIEELKKLEQESKGRSEARELIGKILAGKYKCGLAADSALRYLWDENTDLRAALPALIAVAEAAKEMIGTPDHGYEKGIFVTRDRFEKVRAALAALRGGEEEGRWT